MNHQYSRLAFLLLLFTLVFSGCYTYHNITPQRRSEESELNKPSTVKTKDNQIYEFTKYSINDSTLVGMSADGDSVVISISNVKSIKIKSKLTSVQKTVFGMGIVIMGSFLFVVYLFRDFHM